jgi:hypothetical protein
MPIKFKEDPREWRKSTLLTTLGIALLGSVLRWRGVVPHAAWLWILGALAIVSALAGLRPGWFRGYYHLSMRLGYYLSQAVARLALVAIFFALLTPLSLLFRLLGKDPLRLRKPATAATYWTQTKGTGPLDRMF